MIYKTSHLAATDSTLGNPNTAYQDTANRGFEGNQDRFILYADDLEGKVKERTLQLEKQNQAVKSAQEALLRTTRLAAVGEIVPSSRFGSGAWAL